MTPQRVQRRRVKGWRMPLCSCGCGTNARFVGRGTRYGNPIRITPETNTERHGPRIMYRVHGSPIDRNGGPAYCDIETARHFAAWGFECDLLNGRFPNYPSLVEIRAELAGHDLVCWCPPRRLSRNGSPQAMNCHGDVLLDIAAGAWANA